MTDAVVAGNWMGTQDMLVNHFRFSTVEFLWENDTNLTNTIFDHSRHSISDYLQVSDSTFPFPYLSDGVLHTHIFAERLKLPTVLVINTAEYDQIMWSDPRNWLVGYIFTSITLLFVSLSEDTVKTGNVPCLSRYLACKPLDNHKLKITFEYIPQSATMSMDALELFWEILLDSFYKFYIIIISGEGGTGKTIGRKHQHEYSNDLVFFIKLSQLAPKLRELHGPSFNADNVVNGITKVLNISTSEEEILKEIIKKNAEKRIHFLLDGFAQIEHSNAKIAMKCLKRIRQQFSYSIRVWVTVRPHLLKLLENFLTSLNYIYELQPLDTTQQTQLIISFSGPDGTSPEEYIKTFNQLTNEKGWDLFRLPEQCRLIADVFQDLSVQQQKDAPDRTENKLNEDYLFAEIYCQYLQYNENDI